MAAPTNFSITCVASVPSSGHQQGSGIWTVTAPWGFATAGDVRIALDKVLRPGIGRMAIYLTDSSKTSSNEVPL